MFVAEWLLSSSVLCRMGFAVLLGEFMFDTCSEDGHPLIEYKLCVSKIKRHSHSSVL